MAEDQTGLKKWETQGLTNVFGGVKGTMYVNPNIPNLGQAMEAGAALVSDFEQDKFDNAFKMNF